MELYERLQQRAAAGNPIGVGLVGCGQMGSGLVHVTHQMAGLETVAIADVDAGRALATLQALGIAEAEVCVTTNAGAAEDALRAGKHVVTEDALLLAQLPSLEAVVEATGLTEVGARVAWTCIEHSKHVVMLNVETDVTVGPILHRLARKAGCVYTVASGDEPGVCKMLFNENRALGFEVVCLGKGKNNTIDFDATPDKYRDEALSKGMNPKMLSAFKDGSKTMVEMAAVSNATGLVPDVPGMHGPRDALEHGVRVTGATLFFVDGGVDSGPIIAQRAVEVAEDDGEEEDARVRRRRDRAAPAGLGHNQRLRVVLLGVEDLVGNLFPLQQPVNGL